MKLYKKAAKVLKLFYAYMKFINIDYVCQPTHKRPRVTSAGRMLKIITLADAAPCERKGGRTGRLHRAEKFRGRQLYAINVILGG